MLIDLINKDFYFFLSCLDKLDEYDYKLILTESNDFSGFFCENDKTLTVVMNDEWFPTFVHEFCHFIQYINQTKTWTEGKIGKTSCDDMLDDYIKNNDRYDYYTIRDCCRRIANIELECESMTAQMIVDHKLKINLEKYIQDSNSYICCYYLIPEFGKWMDNKPYSISDSFPMTLDINHQEWAFKLKDKYKEIFFKMENNNEYRRVS